MQTDVFISRKSQDAALAKELYDYFTIRGLTVFESDESLPKMGNSDYRDAIDKALDECTHMIVVGSSIENISSSWVKAEWGFYISEKRTGRKKGNILTVITPNLEISNLPASLRYYEVVRFDKSNFDRIVAYLGKDVNIDEVKQTGDVEKESSSDFSSFIRKTNPLFGKPQFRTGSARYIKHLCTLPAGFANPGYVSPENAHPVDAISYDYYEKYIVTFCLETNKTIIWNSHNGNPIQEIKAGGVIKGCFFDNVTRLIVYTAKNEIVEFTHFNVTTNIHGIEWRETKRTALPALEKFKSPAIFQIADASSGSKKAILVKESDYDAQNYRHGPSLVLIMSDYAEESPFKEYLFLNKDIQYIKKIGNEVFACFTGKSEYLNNVYLTTGEGTFTKNINDIAFVSNDAVNEIFCADNYGIGYMGLSMNDNASSVITSGKKTKTTIKSGSFSLVSGGYESNGKYENRHLLAAAQNDSVSIINILLPGTFQSCSFKGHAEAITKIAWGGSLTDKKSLVNTDLFSIDPSFGEIFSTAFLAISGKAKRSFLAKSFLTTASQDGTIKIWHLVKEIAMFQNVSLIKQIFAWTTKNQFAYADRDGFVHIFEITYTP